MSMIQIFFRITYECDPLHWLAVKSQIMIGSEVYVQWTLKPSRRIELLCLTSGSWNSDPDAIFCMSTREARFTFRRDNVGMTSIYGEVNHSIFD